MNDIKNVISGDPLHILHSKFAHLTDFKEGHSKSSYINSGKICLQLKNYYVIPKYMNDSLMYALQECNKIAAVLMLYFMKNIIGGTSGNRGKPKQYIRVCPEKKDFGLGLRQKLDITSDSNFYTAIERLLDKKIIFINEERLFINFWPLTWDIKNDIFREKINEIIYTEIEREKKKVERIEEGKVNNSV